MPCVSPLKGWKDEETGGIKFRRDGAKEEMEVACGQCLTCRLDRARMWAMRIVHESSLPEYGGRNSFVTLTYRDRRECNQDQLKDRLHIPDDWSLNKKHFQDFMKRLRKHFAPQRIRFFMCGEYGVHCQHGLNMDVVVCPLCNLGRPHYHACLFNCTFPDLVSYGSRNGDLRYTSDVLAGIWKYGFVDVGELNFQSAAYVARYILKKVNGDRADDHYMNFDVDGEITFVTPEFTLMSRRPGIGKAWFDLFKDDVFPSDEVPVDGVGVVKGVPRYYDELFKISDPLSLAEIKEVRKQYHKAHADDFTPGRLLSKYKCAKAKLELVPRSL